MSATAIPELEPELMTTAELFGLDPVIGEPLAYALELLEPGERPALLHDFFCGSISQQLAAINPVALAAWSALRAIAAGALSESTALDKAAVLLEQVEFDGLESFDENGLEEIYDAALVLAFELTLELAAHESLLEAAAEDTEEPLTVDELAVAQHGLVLASALHALRTISEAEEDMFAAAAATSGMIAFAMQTPAPDRLLFAAFLTGLDEHAVETGYMLYD